MSITKRLVEMHGGKVEAHSDGDGAGSEFVVRFPLPVLPLREAGITQQTPSAPNGRRRILVADDNEDSASAMAMMLKLMGYEVSTASDGPEAIQRAEAFRPALILLDIGMPGMNGYDACRHIRQQPGGEEIVIAGLTGWGQEEDKRRSRDAGFNYHLVKPVAPADLEKLLAAVESPPVSGSN